VPVVTDLSPDTAHVREIGLLRAKDPAIWQHAAHHNFILISTDTDFHQGSLIHGTPPKVVWLRIGNVPTAAVESSLRERHLVVRRFAEDPVSAFLPLSAV
jgi:predicted nuclease of predicted toxin-antitoxin system